ncbi:MAG: sugar phosphate isomerase/epimerase, partial [Planctomycetaceae bacterium]|nr:sugar phosphate isomerase/epimerase [Planctomycetaceae bacterium]
DHEKTGRHCQVKDPNGKLDIVKHAGYWLRDDAGNLTRTMRHICWDGCMFPNAVMESQDTWNDILGAMVQVRDAHGWTE